MKSLTVSFVLAGLVAAASVGIASAAPLKHHRHHYSRMGAQAKLGLEKQTKTGGPSGGGTLSVH